MTIRSSKRKSAELKSSKRCREEVVYAAGLGGLGVWVKS